MNKLLDMLTYCRPEGSLEQDLFCETYLDPVFGESDHYGNYILEIGDKPEIAFMAHHDTVHTKGGYQTVTVSNSGHAKSDSNCLGADCTTGVWLILEMIAAGIEGVYVIHAAEEIGCFGSQGIVSYNPKWLDQVNFAISFDRKGTKDIITHQMGMRTASDAFALSFAAATGLDMEADPTGSYTDSNEYANVISECTNISVGYYAQHSHKERQDMQFAVKLRDALVAADWSKLVAERDPKEDGWADWWNYQRDHSDPMEDLISENVEAVAELLRSYGMTTSSLTDELALDNPYYLREVI